MGSVTRADFCEGPHSALAFMLRIWIVLTAAAALAQGQDDILGGDPLGSDQPIFATTTHPKPPSPFWGDLPGPYETNIWWLNLVLDGGDQPVVTYPYDIKLADEGLHPCYPDKVVDQTYVVMEFVDNWIVGATEDLGTRALVKRDHFSATMKYQNGLELPLVRGMPYATFKYTGLTPSLNTIHVIDSINGATESTVTGSKFNIELNNGQSWIIYTSTEITLTWSGSIVSADSPFTGTMRVAVMVDGVSETDLDNYSEKIPVGGSIVASSSGDSADVVINWETDGSGDLLMVALPHHMDVLAVQAPANHKLNGLRGDMTGIVGDSWLMSEPLTNIDWFSPNGIDPSRAESILAALNEDVLGNDVVAGDPYFGGKQMAKLARLSLIAEEMGEDGLAQQFRDKLQPVLEGWYQQMGFQTLMQILAWVIIKTIIFILDITFMPLLSLPRLILLGAVPMKTRSCIMSETLWTPRELTPNILSQGQKIGTWALPGQMVLLLLLGTRRTRNQPQKVSMLGMLSTFMGLP